MESQPVILLTEGFLKGWLSFDYKHPYSKMREDYILAFLDNQNFQKILLDRAKIDAILASGNMTSHNVNSAFASYSKFWHLALPWLDKNSNISGEQVSAEEIDYWKNFLEAADKHKDS